MAVQQSLESPMRYVSATDAKQNFAALLDDAQRGPVVIRRQSRDQAVVISPQEYARLRGLAVADFQEFCDRVGRGAVERGLTERKLAALLRDDG
jgi:prevent-host-death family protein